MRQQIKARRLMVCLTFVACIANSQVQNGRNGFEKVLAGLSIENGSAWELQSRFGKPVSVTEGQRYSNKTRTFEWQRGAVQVRVVKLADPQGDGSIISIELSGSHNDGGIGITGEALQLGDKLADAQRIYTGRRIYRKRAVDLVRVVQSSASTRIAHSYKSSSTNQDSSRI